MTMMGSKWVKMPRAAVEEQIAAHSSCVVIPVTIRQSESSVPCSQRVIGGKRVKALGEVDTCSG